MYSTAAFGRVKQEARFHFRPDLAGLNGKGLRGEGKCEIDYKKKEIFFSPLGSFLTNFGG